MSYRKIEPRMWDDERFSALTPEAKLTWVCILTGPHTSSLPGLSVCGAASLSETLRYGIDTVSKAIGELEASGLVVVNKSARVLCVPNAPKYNPCANAKVLKGWLSLWQNIPECAEKYMHIANLLKSLDIKQAWVTTAWEQTFGTVSVPLRYGIDTVSITKAQAQAGAPPQARVPPYPPTPAEARTEEPARGSEDPPAAQSQALTAEALVWALRARAAGAPRVLLGASGDPRVLLALGEALDGLSRGPLGAATGIHEVLGDWLVAGSQGWREVGRELGVRELCQPGKLAELVEQALAWDAAGRPRIVHGNAKRRGPAPPSRFEGRDYEGDARRLTELEAEAERAFNALPG